MKKVGFATAAMLAVITVACGGGRDESTTENRDATVGTGGEVTTGHDHRHPHHRRRR
jgi:hypothetical protein